MATQSARRLTAGVVRSDPITLYVDGRAIPAYAGETVAAALLAAGHLVFGRDRFGRPRAPYCNMGVCFDCLVDIDGQRVQACMTAATDGLRITLDGSS